MSDHSVELHLDPSCPWCWLTTLWLFEVQAVRPVTITTRLFSLAEVNRAVDDRRDSHNAGERALRVLVAVRRAGGEDAVRAAYRELGEARHERDEALGDINTLRAAAVAAGLAGSLADEALVDESTLTELLGEHSAAVARGAFGVPTISVDGGPAFFGPIIDTRITGEEAGVLWDAAVPLLADPRLFELKRPRISHAEVGRYRRHEPAAV